MTTPEPICRRRRRALAIICFPEVLSAECGGVRCLFVCFFFFQAEDGIRDSECDWSSDVCSSDLKQKTAYEFLNVTGVQTCALPISELQSHSEISYAVFCLRSEEHTSELQSHS